MPKKTYTVKEVAKLLGFSTNTVYKYLDDGSIQAVRLGEEGRFRIPESEVERLLQEKGKSLSDSSASSNIVTGKNTSSVSQFEVKDAPRLFDWFVSFMSISLGFSIIIFPLSNATQLALSYSKLTIPLQIVLMLGGLIILAFDIIKYKGKFWRDMIRGIVGLDYLAMAVMFLLIHSVPLAIGYFTFSVMVFVSTYSSISEKAKFILLLNLMLFLFGVGVIFKQSFFPVFDMLVTKSGGITVFILSWLTLLAVNFYINFNVLKKHKLSIWFVTAPVALISLAYSTYAFTQAYWARAVFCIVISTFTVLFPFADEFEDFTIKSKKEIVYIFAWLLGLLLAGSMLMFFVYRTFESYVSNQISDRINTANDVVLTFMDGNVAQVSAFAIDKELVGAMKSYDEGNSEIANINLRQVYQVSNWKLNRVVLVNKNGKILDTYPFNPTSQGVNIANRDYFKFVKAGLGTYVTGIIQPSSPGIKPTILVSVPIIGEGNEFLGVLIGDIDINELTRRIDQVRFGQTGTYLLVDKSGNYILPPTPDKILTKAPSGSLELKAALGESGEVQGQDSGSMLSILAYRQIDKYGWGLVAQQPIQEAFNPYSATVFIVFLILVSTGVGSLVLFLRLKSPR